MTFTTDGWTTLDRDRIAEVFGLTGGELEDDTWTVDGWVFHFWYPFPPEYAEREFDAMASYRTAVLDVMFGEPPDRLGRWTKVATYSNSGETECPYRNDDATRIVTDDECPLCEEKRGTEHGWIYLGDGWAEIVYRHTEQDCSTVRAESADITV